MTSDHDLARRTVALLVHHLTSTGSAGADQPADIHTVAGLVSHRFRSTPEPAALYACFEQRPEYPALQAEVTTRLTEQLAQDAEFAERLRAALARVQPDRLPPPPAGTARAGAPAARRPTRTRVWLAAAGVVLFAGGALLGSLATSAPGGPEAAPSPVAAADDDTYIYAFTPSDRTPADEFVILSWTPDAQGNLEGTLIEEFPHSHPSTVIFPISGSQHGTELAVNILLAGPGQNFHATLNGDTLTIGGTETLTLRRTTRADFGKALADWKSRHPTTSADPSAHT